MPELPEMETYRSLLTEKVRYKKITEVEVQRPKTINIPPSLFEESLIATEIQSIERRGKHLIFRLASGQSLLLHLMLGGFMYFGSKQDKLNRTAQVTISFGGEQLFFHGLRLGFLHIYSNEEVERRLSDLGPEPLSSSFTEERFHRIFERKKGMLKTTLQDQHFLAGIGNCYADEICYTASLLPMRKMNTLNKEDINRLYSSIQKVLHEAIHLGGYMEFPLFHGDSLTGGYNQHCMVYDRSGEPCQSCGQNIIQVKLSSRKAFYCSNCQK